MTQLPRAGPPTLPAERVRHAAQSGAAHVDASKARKPQEAKESFQEDLPLSCRATGADGQSERGVCPVPDGENATWRSHRGLALRRSRPKWLPNARARVLPAREASECGPGVGQGVSDDVEELLLTSLLSLNWCHRSTGTSRQQYLRRWESSASECDSRCRTTPRCLATCTRLRSQRAGGS